MVKLVLTLCGMIFIFILWIFATSSQVNGQHNKAAFIVKSIFYWFAITIAFLLGYIISKPNI
jgi:hypothetical protein